MGRAVVGQGSSFITYTSAKVFSNDVSILPKVKRKLVSVFYHHAVKTKG
jgi:hypothetical protein